MNDRDIARHAVAMVAKMEDYHESHIADQTREWAEILGLDLDTLRDSAFRLPSVWETPGLITGFASKGRPMSTRQDLMKEVDERYKAGEGPWTKDETLDQVDFVYFERMAELLEENPDWDPLQIVPQSLRRLVKELRNARSWPTPPDINPNFTYETPK